MGSERTAGRPPRNDPEPVLVRGGPGLRVEVVSAAGAAILPTAAPWAGRHLSQAWPAATPLVLAAALRGEPWTTTIPAQDAELTVTATAGDRWQITGQALKHGSAVLRAVGWNLFDDLRLPMLLLASEGQAWGNAAAAWLVTGTADWPSGLAGSELFGADDWATLDGACRATRALPPLPVQLLRRHNDPVDVEVLVHRLPEQQSTLLVVWDVNSRTAANRELAHLATHDPLTGLANRLALTDRLQHALARLARDAAPFGLLYLDLDRFKGVNDTFGHAVGDRVLIDVARRLRRALRPADTASRLGGDEFVILAESVTSGEALLTLANRLEAILSHDYRLEDDTITLSASIGLTFVDSSEHSADELLRAADASMYAVKRRRSGGV